MLTKSKPHDGREEMRAPKTITSLYDRMRFLIFLETTKLGGWAPITIVSAYSHACSS